MATHLLPTSFVFGVYLHLTTEPIYPKSALTHKIANLIDKVGDLIDKIADPTHKIENLIDKVDDLMPPIGDLMQKFAEIAIIFTQDAKR